MADEIIKRKDLIRQIDKIELDDWICAAQKLGFAVTQPTKGSSHYAIRKAGYAPEDIRGLVSTIYRDLHKQDKPKVFKKLVLAGVAEDDIWKALGML